MTKTLILRQISNWQCRRTMCSCEKGRCPELFGTHSAAGLQVFGCLILSVAYNYSQYCYFGVGYLPVLGYEFQSRDTAA